jgi:hypothetical protein
MGVKVDMTTHETDPINVEKLGVKRFKTHCCALDFATTYYKAT